jgi:hypothetical protein
MKILILSFGALLIAWPWIHFEAASGTGRSSRKMGWDEGDAHPVQRALAMLIAWRWLVAYVGLVTVVLGLLL